MDDVRAFLDASEAFFKAFAAVAWGAMLLAVAFQLIRLLMRVRGWQNILQAAYPETKVRYWSTFGAYMAGVGVNAVVPARGGDVVKLYIARHRVEGSSYPTLASSLVVETLFDFVVAVRALPRGRSRWGSSQGCPTCRASPPSTGRSSSSTHASRSSSGASSSAG